MTNKDFFEALKDLEAEKGINEEVFISALEQALTAAYKKNSGMAKNAQVKLNPEKHTIKIYSYKTVVDEWNADVATERLLLLASKILDGEISPEPYGDGVCSRAK